MGHPSKYLEDLKNVGGVARGVKFDLLLGIDFYDGPETGFVFYSSGERLRFSVIAEAKYPILRAFAFDLLDGNWAQMVGIVADTSPPKSGWFSLRKLMRRDRLYCDQYLRRRSYLTTSVLGARI
jgi:hypothetical protein